MGSEYNFQALQAKTLDGAKKEAQALIEQAGYEHGHGGYSGSWAECRGVEVIGCAGTSPENIEDWLGDHAQKWGPMLITECGGRWFAGAWCSS
jgi:hypothetical protein